MSYEQLATSVDTLVEQNKEIADKAREIVQKAEPSAIAASAAAKQAEEASAAAVTARDEAVPAAAVATAAKDTAVASADTAVTAASEATTANTAAQQAKVDTESWAAIAQISVAPVQALAENVSYVAAPYGIPQASVDGVLATSWFPPELSSADYVNFSHVTEYRQGSLGKKLKQVICVEDAPFNGDIQAAVDHAAGLAAAAQQSDKVPVMVSVTLQPGKIYSASVVLKKGVALDGQGSVIKLPDGANKSVIETMDYQSLSGTNSGLGVWNWEVRNVTLDGNMANNLSPPAKAGHGLACYGRNFAVVDVISVNCVRRGVTLEYGTGAVGTSPFNGSVRGVLVDTCGEHGAYFDVSDMHVDDLNIRSAGQAANNTFDGLYAPKGIRATNVNIWRGGDTTNTHRYSVNLSDGCTLSGAHLETAATANLNMSGNRSKVTDTLSYNLLGGVHAIVAGSGHCLKLSTHNGGVTGENLDAVGVQLGVAGTTANYCDIELVGIAVRGGVINFANSGGGNQVGAGVWLNADTDPIYLGTPHLTDSVSITGSGSGSVNKSYKKLPSRNGSINGVGTTQAGAAPLVTTVNRAFASNSSNNAFLLPKATGGDVLYVANISSVPIQVFPAVGDSILGLATNAADTLAAGACKQYVTHSTTQWGFY